VGKPVCGFGWQQFQGYNQMRGDQAGCNYSCNRSVSEGSGGGALIAPLVDLKAASRWSVETGTYAEIEGNLAKECGLFPRGRWCGEIW